MGGTTGHDAVREAASRAVRCYLCMAAPSTQVVKGFGEGLVNVCTFCYNALQGLNLEGQHDEGPTG